jgi:uncharacterized SAM-binding protein YcdF (DUF218 family)
MTRMSRWLARVLEVPLVVRDALEPLDAIVVLGAPLKDDALSDVLAERVAAAAALYHGGGAPIVVATGGVTGRATRAEAAVIAEALAARGVPPTAIVVEDRSRTTAENATCAAALLGARRRVWLVTQPFHARRARWLFRRAGFDPRVWHIADSIEYRDRRRALRWLSREYGAWARALLRRTQRPAD